MLFKEKKIIVLAFYLVLTFCGCERTSYKVLNIYEAKDCVKQYHESGKYLQDVTFQKDRAKKYITNRLKKVKPNEKLAIVFDIDDTLLTQYEHALETDFSQMQTLLMQWKKKAQIPPLIPIIDLFNFVKEKGLSIFIITGRKSDLLDPTIQNLNKVGLKEWTEIYFDTTDQNYATTQEYKAAVRKKITQNGYTIIVNIGDQNSDLLGGYAEKSYKLPNHIYLIK